MTIAARETLDWRRYPKGTFILHKPSSAVFGLVNKDYSFFLEVKMNVRIDWSTVLMSDAKVLGYVPQDFFK